MRQSTGLMLLVMLLPLIIGVAWIDTTWSAALISDNGLVAELNLVVRALVWIAGGVWVLPYFKAFSLSTAAAIAAYVIHVARTSQHEEQRKAAQRAVRLIVFVATTVSLFLLGWWALFGAIDRRWIS